MTSTVAWPPVPGEPVELAPGVVHVLAPNASPWTADGTNTWLIGIDKTCIVVDPGDDTPAHLAAVSSAAHRRGWRIAGVLMTHDHVDHRQGCAELARAHSAPVIAARHGGPVSADGIVTAGEVRVEVIATPGHSDDSVTFLMPQLGVALTGDTVVGRRSSAVMGSLTDYFSSLARLRDLVAEHDPVMLPGHGPVVENASAVLDKIEDVRRARVDQIARLVDSGEVRVSVIVERLYPHITDARVHAARASVVSSLQYLADTRGMARFWSSR